MKNKLPIFLLFALLFLLAACGNSTPSQASSTQSTPTTKPTTAVTPTKAPSQVSSTPTIAPSTSKDTTLGQPIANFVNKYGQPGKGSNLSGGLYNFENLDLSVTTVKTDVVRSYAISYSNTDQAGWSSIDTAATSCRLFLPSDAKFSKTAAGSNGDTQRVYISASMASLFPASSFVDQNGNTTTPGTIAIVYTPDMTNPNRIDTCSIQMGMEGD